MSADWKRNEPAPEARREEEQNPSCGPQAPSPALTELKDLVAQALLPVPFDLDGSPQTRGGAGLLGLRKRQPEKYSAPEVARSRRRGRPEGGRESFGQAPYSSLCGRLGICSGSPALNLRWIRFSLQTFLVLSFQPLPIRLNLKV